MRELADRARERVTFRHYDFVALALAKIERGHARDLADVAAMRERNLIRASDVRRMFEEMEPALYRFPAIDPLSFRRAVELFVSQGHRNEMNES